MTIEKKQSITQFGLTNLQEELDHLKSVKRKEVIARIKASRCFGLIENSDYETAREDQAFVESRIIAIETIIRNAEIIDTSKLDSQIVQIGSTVTIKEMPDGELETYTVVGSAEANPLGGSISSNSPIAQKVLDKRVGDQVEVTIPSGKITIQIKSIV
ncbi:transcription elongation factor GreA [Paenisporosarcina sp.]|uniref:transcription elongation factor GreA n=1 Tax=Paenisporosarcina sp. TaxID=1932001 RepID=UPI003C728804